MKNSISIILVVVVVGAGAWFFWPKDSTTDNENTNSRQNITITNTNRQSSASRSVGTLLAEGQSSRCAFTLTDPNGDQNWILFTDGARVRGDYTVSPSDDYTDWEGPWEGHMIRDEQYSYNWGNFDGQEFGTKIELTTVETDTNVNSSTNTNSSARSLDFQQEVDMDCSPWTVDDAMFDPPSDVTFTDLTAQTETLTNSSIDFKSAQCEACNQQADPTQIESCRQALGC